MDKYGETTNLKCKQTKDKIKATNLKRYGVDNPSKCTEIKEKRKKTCLERYYVDNPAKLEKVKNKYKKTCMDKYGVDNPSKSKKIKEKKKQTCLVRYGVDNPSKLEYIKEKTKQTNLNKYGEITNLKCKHTKDKIRETNITKYGKYIYSKTNEFKDKLHKNNLEKFIKNISINRTDIDYIEFTGEYYYTKYVCRWKCKTCNTIFEDHGASTSNWLHPRCPVCNPIQYTSIENKIYNYLTNYISDSEINRCNRQVITPYELDLYVPSINLAIECDGDYWHSDEVLLNHYGITHDEYCKLKNNLCKEQGITLLRFTESEINNEFENVKCRINNYLGGDLNETS